MKVAWIILDSLSFEATPFATDGPPTMPELEALTRENGVLFTSAYSPGISSASSHGSFFTGRHPSASGMHSVHSYYDGEYDTIAHGASSDTKSLLISSNPFIFRGLDEGFDKSDDIALRNNYMIFNDATDPKNHRFDNVSGYLEFIRSNGNIMKNLVNGLSYKIDSLSSRISNSVEMYQYTDYINERINEWTSLQDDYLIVANYMHAHAPLDATEKAIQRFVSSQNLSNLPIGERGHDVHEAVKNGNERIGELMYNLYKASIWDLDQKVAPTVEALRRDGAFVVVTADHGNWFRRKSELDERRIHVPLIIFPPNEDEHQTIDYTVNIRALPKTTVKHNTNFTTDFPGYDLLSVSKDKLSITEELIGKNVSGNPVSAYGETNPDFDWYVSVIKNGARVNSSAGAFKRIRGDDATIAELKERLERHLNKEPKVSPHPGRDRNPEMEDRLRALGYIG